MHRILMVAALPIILGGCAASLPPAVISATDPADVTIGTKPAHHHNAVSGYVHRQPTDPKPWRKLNEDVSPNQGEAS